MNVRHETFSAELLSLGLAELEAEIHESISHIACNDLRALEESLWKQELLALKLFTSVTMQKDVSGSPAARQVLQSMANSLSVTNHSYGELLQQVRRENARLLELCLEYHDGLQPERFTNLQCSCEV